MQEPRKWHRGEQLESIPFDPSAAPEQNATSVAEHVASRLSRGSELKGKDREREAKRGRTSKGHESEAGHEKGRSKEGRTHHRKDGSNRVSHAHADYESRREPSRRRRDAVEEGLSGRCDAHDRNRHEHSSGSHHKHERDHRSRHESWHGDHYSSREASDSRSQARKGQSSSKTEQLDFETLIPGYKEMSAGQRMKARTKLLLARNSKQVKIASSLSRKAYSEGHWNYP